MALNKVTYTDDVTVIEAQNLNNIQDEIISLETVELVAVNSDLDTVTTPGVYRVWGAYTNSPVSGNMYGYLTVTGVTGAISQTYQSVTSANSYFRGYTNSQWYPWRQYMLNSGGTFSGTLYIDRKDGTTSATGTSTLWLGNSTPTGTDGNSKGQVVLYGNGANYVNIQATNATGNRTVELPNANGTIALVGTNSANYTPTITAPSATGFSVDNVSFYYKITSDFLWINGRFRVANHGTGNSNISISYPSGVTTIQEVGSFGTVHCNNNVNTSGLSIRPANDGKSMFIQSGAGNVVVNSIIPNGDYIVLQAMIPLR